MQGMSSGQLPGVAKPYIASNPITSPGASCSPPVVLFCLLLLGALLTINFFLFQSALPMNATLNVSRGTVSISDLANPFEQVGVNGSVIAGGAIVRTDLQSREPSSLWLGEEQQASCRRPDLAT